MTGYPIQGYGSENDERRKVDRDSIARRIPNEEPEPEPPWEPDFEGIMERRHERRRPDWA